MKYLIRKNSFKLVGMSLLFFLASSCTKDFEGLNQDSKTISDHSLEQDFNDGGFRLPIMMNNIVSTTTSVQTQQNLQADSYANYLESPGEFIGNVNTITYATRGVWPGSWNVSTTNVMDNWITMKKRGYDTKYPDLYAIALIIKVAAGHRLVDTFGPYPYSQYGVSNLVEWDSPEKAYSTFFEDLDLAIKSLKEAKAENPRADAIRFAKWDRSSLGGDYNKWIKLANSLRLRLAIRISNADPAKAKAESEKAVDAANGGLLDGSTGSFSVVNPTGNPYFTMSGAWSDTRISAAVVTYLEGLSDPRLSVYALPANDPRLGGTFRGIRPGVEKDKLKYGEFSKYNVKITDPVKIVDGAESYFLRAEGALRGWNMGGTAQSLYEEGIRTSIMLNGASGADAYLQSTSTQLAYVDPTTPAYDSPALTDVTVKWDENLDFEKKLEKIITQKWITMFPEGTEGWSEFRRTGYPKLYPIMSSKNPLLPFGTFIKRLTYPVTVVSTNSDQYKAAVNEYLGGKDDENVTFYWMKK